MIEEIVVLTYIGRNAKHRSIANTFLSQRAQSFIELQGA